MRLSGAVDEMGRVGYLMTLFGFAMAWPAPVVGVLIMVAGAITAAIAWETAMLPAPSTPAEVDAQSSGPDTAGPPLEAVA